jgi:putative selenium metabolism protein SsnA
MTLALTGGLVLTSVHPARLIEVDVVTDGSRVSELGQGTGHPETIDCSGCLIVPGNVCAHTHLYSALARGMPYSLEPPANFVQILQRIWWRLDRGLDEESIRASALVGGMEALLAGTTTLVDHHASPNAIDGSLDVVADALEEVGIRSILCYEVTDRDGAERAHAGLAENERFLRTAADGRRPLTRAMVGAHASFTLGPETLDACVELARRESTGLHVHVAEDFADQADCEARFGMSVLERLARAGALTPQALLAHCVYLNPAEIALTLESGATIAHNPRSNMNNSVGRALVHALEDRVVLGTDGIGGDMFAESQVAYWRAREDQVFASPSETLARLAGGARFAGRVFSEPSLGSIEPGAPADLLVLDYASPAPVTETNLGGHWMFGLSARHVRDVLVNGEVVVRDRRPTRIEPEKVAAEAAEAAEPLFGRLESIGEHPFQPRGSE